MKPATVSWDICLLLLNVNILFQSACVTSLGNFENQRYADDEIYFYHGTGCSAPTRNAQTNMTFFCANDTSHSCKPERGFFPEFTIARVHCASGYQLAGGKDNENLDYVCNSSIWQPWIPYCLKICEKLYPENVELKCHNNGNGVPCDGSTVLLEGTRASPSCKKGYEYSTYSIPEYSKFSDMACKSDGKWDNFLFSCVLECGKINHNTQVLTTEKKTEPFDDSPWHIAIYNQNKTLVCSGTIITEYLVLTAAHCFYSNFDTAKENINKDNYEIVVGKVTRNYSVIDNEVQKTYKIKDIRFSEKGFFGLRTNYQADIAIVVLNEKINISSKVLPACVNWISSDEDKYPTENMLGKVAGWENRNNDTYNENLMSIHLPFISHKRCVQLAPDNFKTFVTFDKFCAGSENVTSEFYGNSGSGLVFKQNSSYYLQGIVGLKEDSGTGIVAFTDVSEHIRWILKVRREVENEFQKANNQTQTHGETSL